MSGYAKNYANIRRNKFYLHALVPRIDVCPPNLNFIASQYISLF